jgi:hypothetical protein
MGGACSRNGEMRKAFRLLVGKTEGNRPLGRPRRRWVDNIKMNFRETGLGGIEWIDLASRQGLSSIELTSCSCTIGVN